MYLLLNRYVENEEYARLLSQKAGSKMKSLYVKTGQQMMEARRARASAFCEEVESLMIVLVSQRSGLWCATFYCSLHSDRRSEWFRWCVGQPPPSAPPTAWYWFSYNHLNAACVLTQPNRYWWNGKNLNCPWNQENRLRSSRGPAVSILTWMMHDSCTRRTAQHKPVRSRVLWNWTCFTKYIQPLCWKNCLYKSLRPMVTDRCYGWIVQYFGSLRWEISKVNVAGGFWWVIIS